jgi:hypothetical protein
MDIGDTFSFGHVLVLRIWWNQYIIEYKLWSSREKNELYVILCAYT